MRKFLVFIFGICLVAICACSSHQTQSYYHRFADNSWQADSSISISFCIDDTSKLYSIAGSIRYFSDFSFSNLGINICMTSPSGAKRYTNKNFEMRNKNGLNAGDKKDDCYELSFEIYSSIRFNETGKWTLDFNQLLPVDINSGLQGLGVFIRS